MRRIGVIVSLCLAGCSVTGGDVEKAELRSYSSEFGLVTEGCIDVDVSLDDRLGDGTADVVAALDCAPAGPNELTMTWTDEDGAHTFVLDGLDYHDCTYRPGYDPGDGALLNEIFGDGWGTLDGETVHAMFVFRDGGEPGDSYDHGSVKLWNADDTLVAWASGNPIDGGNVDVGECEPPPPPPPADECTYTQGYWENHNRYRENRNQQDPWPNVPGWTHPSEDAELCGMTMLEILEEPTHGDAWYILAHQWIAAKLNVANGASREAIDAELRQARRLLEECEIADDDRERAIDLAGTLDDYNNGLIGPGHCDDEVSEND